MQSHLKLRLICVYGALHIHKIINKQIIASFTFHDGKKKYNITHTHTHDMPCHCARDDNESTVKLAGVKLLLETKGSMHSRGEKRK